MQDQCISIFLHEFDKEKDLKCKILVYSILLITILAFCAIIVVTKDFFYICNHASIVLTPKYL